MLMSCYSHQQQNTGVMSFLLFGSVWLRRHPNSSSGTDTSWYWVASRVNCDALNGSVGKLPSTWTMWLKKGWWQPEAYGRRQKTYKAFRSDRYYLLIVCFSVWKINLEIGSCRKTYLDTFISLYGLPYLSCIVGAGTGVENDELTMLSARIMVLSVIPFIVAQLARIFNFTSIGNIPVIVACVLSFAGLLSYCLYQVSQLYVCFLKLSLL